jgi:ribosomal protein L32E
MGKLIDLTAQFKREQRHNKNRRRWKASAAEPLFTVHATYFDPHGIRHITASGTMTALAYWMAQLAALDTIRISKINITPGVNRREA